MSQLYVIDSRGEREPFSMKKVRNSARRVGASASVAQSIAAAIRKQVYPGMPTYEIFDKVKRLLAKENKKGSLKFNLKRAMRDLGPTGFPFEKYIAEILERGGYEVKINQFLSGVCLKGYEIDFVAKKNGITYIGECKYRNMLGDRIHLKHALSNYARFLDISEAGKYNGRKTRSMLVTNTKFTVQAKKYSSCRGVELLGWRHPAKGGLETLIEDQKLYPVTILPSLKRRTKDLLISNRVVLAEELLSLNLGNFSRRFNVSLKELESLAKEANILMSN